MQEDEAVWQEQSARYGIHAIFWSYNDITPWSQTFVQRITRDPQWATVYHDKGIMILVKKVPQNAAIIAKYQFR